MPAYNESPYDMTSPKTEEVQEAVIEQSRCPVSRLPVEILADIFVRSVTVLYSRPIPKSQQILLCGVCGHWRQIALSTPLLWTSIDIETHSSYRPHYYFLSKLWLERSQTYPLSLRFTPSFNPGANSIVTDPIFALFLDHIHRWRRVSLYINGWHVMEQFLAAITNNKRLVVEGFEIIAHDCTAEQTERLSGALRSFTHLRHLTYARNSWTSLLSIPWYQLTCIRLDCPIPMDECIGLLAQCTKVVDVFMWNIMEPLGSITADETLLSDLVTCSLQSICDVGALLVHFTCPNMRSLTVSQDTNYRNTALLDLFFTRSRCNLKNLVFHDKWSAESDLIEYLSIPSLQTLQMLEVFCYSLGDQTVNLLTGDDRGLILPCLKVIRLRHCSSSDGKLADMIASRWSSKPDSEIGISPLELVFLEFQLLPSEERLDSRGTEREVFLQCHKDDISRFRYFAVKGLKVLWSAKLPY